MIYLAVPYTNMEELSYKASMAVTAALSKKNKIVFSPILHNHPMAVSYDLPGSFEYWEAFNRAHIESCTEFMCICLDGWEDSTGVDGEVRLAESLGMPIMMLEVKKKWRVKDGGFVYSVYHESDKKPLTTFVHRD